MFKMELGFNPYDNKTNQAFNQRDCEMRGKFIHSFGGEQNIYCYNGDPRKKISTMSHTADLTLAVHANLNNSSDVYFYVNGGRKQYAINEFRSCFVDIDAGRDSTGNYLSSKEVMRFKQATLDKINSFSVTPSWVVDTRNGYQVYWILDKNSRHINKQNWNGLQKKLVNYFGGDARAIKTNQIYRVPYTWWRKCWEKKASYYSTVLQGSTGQIVNVQDLIAALTGQPATVNIVPNATSDAWFDKWRETYKKSDNNGLPVSFDAATKILNELNSQKTVYTNSVSDSCCQKNTKDNAWGDFGKTYSINKEDPNKYVDYKCNKSFGNNYEKTYGDPSPTLPSHAGNSGLDLSESQAKLLKTVVEYLNQASTALYFSNNRFLSGAARDLANQISDKFCIG